MRILRKWTLAIALYLALILDGSLSYYLHQFMSYDNIGASCWIMAIGIMLIGFFDDTNSKEIWLALGAGIVADIYSLGIIGVYTAFFPLSCWVCQRVNRFLPEVFVVRLVVALFGLTILDIYNWAVLNIFGLISVSVNSLLLSLALNLIWASIFFGLTYWLWGKLIRNYPFMIDLTVYRQ